MRPRFSKLHVTIALSALVLLVVFVMFLQGDNERVAEYPTTTAIDYTPQELQTYTQAPVITPPAYVTEQITIGNEWQLQGYLQLPYEVSEQNPVPAVIMINSTMTDFSIDIANQLAANGIAALRYDRREADSALHGNFTIWDWIIEDVLYAAELLLSDERICSDRIFFINGGDYAANALRVQLEAKERGFELAGLILMSNSTRDFIEISLPMLAEQIDFIHTFIEEWEDWATDYGAPEEAAIEIAAIQEFITTHQELLDELKNLASTLHDIPAEQARENFIFETSYYHIQDIANHPFEKMAAQVYVPMLIMHGERNFHMPADIEITLFKQILADRENVTFKLYEGLNNFFIRTNSANITEDMQEMMNTTRRVDTQVLQDIVSWILSFQG